MQSDGPRHAREPCGGAGRTSDAGRAGCKGEIAGYRAIMDNDLAMGHVNKSVYDKVEREIGQAETVCGAGRGAEAIRMVEATKARDGYR